MIFSAEQSRQDDARGLAKQPNPDVGINGGILLGGIVPDDPRKVTYNKEQNQDIHNDLYSAKMTWNVGETKVQSITAYQTTDLDLKYELDGTNVDFSSDSPAINAHSGSKHTSFICCLENFRTRSGWVTRAETPASSSMKSNRSWGYLGSRGT